MTSLNYAWLPEHQLHVAATLAHADEVIGQITEILFEYQTSPDGIFKLKEVPIGSCIQTVVDSVAPIPKKVPLLVADALVVLRNAIEHTLFAEIQHRDGTLDVKGARAVEMPAMQSYETFQDWVKSRAKNGSPSLQRGSELLKRIDCLQPYHRTIKPEEHPMALLALHTNHAKHRAPALTAVRLAAVQREDRSPPSLSDVERRPEVPMQVGDVIAVTPIGQRIPVALYPTIGINRPGTNSWPVLIMELEYVAEWVRTQAIPRLITGADPTAVVLPARYVISVSQRDERATLVEGTKRSAAKLYGERLKAATGRNDMVEIICQMEDAPSEEKIATWLESLSDQEMLARMRQLQAIAPHDPKTLLSNYAVLEAMRDDARRFAGPHDDEQYDPQAVVD